MVFYCHLPIKQCGKIIQVRSVEADRVFILTDCANLVEIENVAILSRFNDPNILLDKFNSGQLLKLYKLHGTVKDFLVLPSTQTEPDKLSIFTTGDNPMIAWWSVSKESTDSFAFPINIKFPFIKLSTESPEQKKTPNFIDLKTDRILNEPDRSLTKIIAHSNTLALVEDSQHGRILLIDTKIGLILRIFKGYREGSGHIDLSKMILKIWSQNRFQIETWPIFGGDLLEVTDKNEGEFQACNGSFADQNVGEQFIIYNPKKCLLQIYQ